MQWKKLLSAGLILPSLITAGDFVFCEKVSAEILQVEKIFCAKERII